MMLNEDIKQKVLDFIELIEIDVTDLDSCYFEKNPYGVESALIGNSGEYMWDSHEEWQEKVRTMIGYLNRDSVGEYIELDEKVFEQDLEDMKLTGEVINWLKTLIGEE